VGLRLVPMERDLRFAWEETAHQVLDEQKQKMRESGHAALIQWARSAGEGTDYTDNEPLQCLHPVGHWYEVPNLLRNGVLRDLLEARRIGPPRTLPALAPARNAGNTYPVRNSSRMSSTTTLLAPVL
jgi:hypothetical protein